MFKKIAIRANASEKAQKSLSRLVELYGQYPICEADVIIALGGDGFMLQTLHLAEGKNIPVYGMNRGAIGFMMNGYQEADLLERLEKAEETLINPLAMTAFCLDGSEHTALAFNEVSLLRAGPQAAKLKISVDHCVRMEELVCDGALLATPAGSTAYNYSAHGPILPIDADVFALTALNAFRPRRWRGALLPKKAQVAFEVLEADKRPVMADADSRSFRNVSVVKITSAASITHKLLFDPGHGLKERLIREQFV